MVCAECWHLPFWPFPEVLLSCCQYQVPPQEQHLLALELPGHITTTQYIHSGLTEVTERFLRCAYFHLTLSIIPFTTKGFLRMCCPMPVLNMIPSEHNMNVTYTLHFTFYSCNMLDLYSALKWGVEQGNGFVSKYWPGISCILYNCNEIFVLTRTTTKYQLDDKTWNYKRLQRAVPVHWFI